MSVKNKTDPLKIVHYSNLCEGKGLLTVLETASHLDDDGMKGLFQIDIFGAWVSSKVERFFWKEIRQRSLESAVVYRGIPGESDCQSPWDGAELFFFPSFFERENYPLVIVEALASGVPVLASRWRGIPEQLEDGRFGWLCDVKQPRQYAEVIQGLLSDRGELVEVKKRCQLAGNHHRSVRTFQNEVEEAVMGERSSFRPLIETLSAGKTKVGRKPELAVLGHFGGHNIGDEAMLGGFFALLAEASDAPIESLPIRLFTKRPYEVGWLDKMRNVRQCVPNLMSGLRFIPRNGLFVLCGGTHYHDDYSSVRLMRHLAYLFRLCMFLKIARMRRCRVFLLGQGWGPFGTPFGRLLAKFAYSLSHEVTCRDQASADDIQSLVSSQSDVTVAPDLAWGLISRLKRPSQEREELVGVSLTEGNGCRNEDNGWIDALAQSLAGQLTRNPLLKVELWCFRGGSRESDEALSVYFRGKLLAVTSGVDPLRISIRSYRDDPSEVLALLLRCRYFVATRFHSAVLAHAAGCRLVILAYHRKLMDFSNEFLFPSEAVVDLKNKDAIGGIECAINFLIANDQSHKIKSIPATDVQRHLTPRFRDALTNRNTR
jgi:polysaccharide pyruvyl transferase WcaK-like protein